MEFGFVRFCADALSVGSAQGELDPNTEESPLHRRLVFSAQFYHKEFPCFPKKVEFYLFLGRHKSWYGRWSAHWTCYLVCAPSIPCLFFDITIDRPPPELWRWRILSPEISQLFLPSSGRSLALAFREFFRYLWGVKIIFHPT